MKFLCQLFGHQPPVYAERGWFSPGQEYAKKVTEPFFDGIGRGHSQVFSECPRCGEIFRLCRIHIPPQRITSPSMNEALTAEIAEIKAIRRDADALIQRTRTIGKPTRERSLVITKFQEGVMWLGMDLKRTHDEANPYPESKNPDSPAIAPTADGLKL